MGIIKISDIAFVRFCVPDFERLEKFLEDFGLIVSHSGDQRISAHGAGPAPVLYMAEVGEPKFAGLGLQADSLEDLERLAEAEGVDVQPFNAPGGGHVVALKDPDGNLVEIVAGQTAREPGCLPDTSRWNSAHMQPRVREAKRLPPEAAHVVRLGHAVLNVGDFRASEAWYKERFGFITSDEITLSPDFSIGAFMRCDRGDAPTDHHTLFLIQSPKGASFNHAAFEVVDMDDLMVGHERLKSAGYQPEWGIGRHILGSQVFDYWRDPWGHTLEHWTDGDLFVARDGSNTATIQELMGVQWGPPAPQTMG